MKKIVFKKIYNNKELLIKENMWKLCNYNADERFWQLIDDLPICTLLWPIYTGTKDTQWKGFGAFEE